MQRCAVRLSKFATTALALVTSTAGAASFITLGDLPGGANFSSAAAISGDGAVVVGNSAVGGSSDRHAFRWTEDGGMVDLGTLPHPAPMVSSYAFSVSGDGSVVVGVSDGYPNGGGFRWTSDVGMVPLMADPYGFRPNAVSSDGSIIAGENHLTGVAFRWTSAEGPIGLGDLPGGGFFSRAYGISADGSVIVGASEVSDDFNTEAFSWTADGGMVGIGGNRSAALAASANGSVIVGYSDQEAFRWTAADGLVGLGGLAEGVIRSQANAVSADGAVVVGTSLSLNRPGGNATDEAFIWTAANGMQRLFDVLVYQGVTGLDGWLLLSATGISADGTTIVGLAEDPNEVRQAYIAKVTVVPAPAVGWLIGITFGVVTWTRRSARERRDWRRS